MAPKVQYTKDEIVDAAFKIACSEGLSKITVRRVADDLGCSVAPIYVNFTNSQDLLDQVLEKISILSREMSLYPYSEISFLNIGIGTMKFAMEYPVLFKEFVMQENNNPIPTEEEFISLLQLMRTFNLLEKMTDAQLKKIFWKMKVFTNGLCILIATHSLPKDMGWDQLVDLLRETGFEIIEATLAQLEEKK